MRHVLPRRAAAASGVAGTIADLVVDQNRAGKSRGRNSEGKARGASAPLLLCTRDLTRPEPFAVASNEPVAVPRLVLLPEAELRVVAGIGLFELALTVKIPAAMDPILSPSFAAIGESSIPACTIRSRIRGGRIPHDLGSCQNAVVIPIQP